MRAAERRWRRAFQGILLASLAACRSPADVADASTDDAEPEDDGACQARPFDAGVDDDCSTFVTLPCGLPDGATVSECYPNLAGCFAACGTTQILYCALTPTSCAPDGGAIEGPALVECYACTGGGRRPRGLRASTRCSCSELGDYFARLAWMEAASVRAFRDLGRSLSAAGAPSRLVAAVGEAERDERRHARSMARLARRFGGVVERVRVRRGRAPKLAALLEENAIEGCASETFGALVATWQGMHATDSGVRAAMQRIAHDETRHAALAWEILAWGLPKVSARERERVGDRLDAALRACGKSGSALGASARRVVGQPEPAIARRLAASLQAHIIKAGASPTRPSPRRRRG